MDNIEQQAETTSLEEENQTEDTTQEAPEAPTKGEETQQEESAEDRIHRLEKELSKVRNEASKSRVKARDARQAREDQATQFEKQLNEIKRVLGLESTENDPEQLAKELQGRLDKETVEKNAAMAELKQFRTRSELHRLATKAGANPDLMVPYLVGAGVELPEYDPENVDDFRSQVGQIMVGVLQDYPQFAARVTAQTSGNLPDAGRENSRELTRDDIQKMSPEEIYKALKAGKLKNIHS